MWDTKHGSLIDGMVQWKRKLCPTHISDYSGFIYVQSLEFWDDTFLSSSYSQDLDVLTIAT